MTPASFIYEQNIHHTFGHNEKYRLRGRNYYNFQNTSDKAYHMINDESELAELYQGVPAWSGATGGFLNYLHGNGQLADIDTSASYAILKKQYKEAIPDSYHTPGLYDGGGSDISFYQKMYYLITDFSYQHGPQTESKRQRKAQRL